MPANAACSTGKRERKCYGGTMNKSEMKARNSWRWQGNSASTAASGMQINVVPDMAEVNVRSAAGALMSRVFTTLVDIYEAKKKLPNHICQSNIDACFTWTQQTAHQA